MSLSDDIRVLCVPEHLQDAMWPHVVPLLRKGLTAAKTSTLEEIKADMDRGTDRLWCVFENERLVAAFMSAIYTDQGAYLALYALGGQGMWKWARQIDATMQAEAKRRGVPCIRFAGRKAWSRVLPNLGVRGERDGHVIWERAA